MATIENIAKLIQYHNGIDHFNYDWVVNWAINLIMNGIETDNILILASFSKPVDSVEIRPYLSLALKELSLDEKEGDEAVFALIQYYLSELLLNNRVRAHLELLYDLSLDKDCFKDDDKFGLRPFYLLYHAWNELEDIGKNYYFEGADLNNIYEVIKEQAQEWMDKYKLET